MKPKHKHPFPKADSKPSTAKKPKSKNKPKLLECGDIYMLRTDSKKKALAVLQSKLHGERKNLPRTRLSDYDPLLADVVRGIRGSFESLERRLKPKSQIKQTIAKRGKWKKQRGRKVRLGLFAKMLAQVKQETPKVRNIGIPKLESISSK